MPSAIGWSSRNTIVIVNVVPDFRCRAFRLRASFHPRLMSLCDVGLYFLQSCSDYARLFAKGRAEIERSR
jgi:hypothetical protein